MVGYGNGKIEARNVQTGEIKWTYQFEVSVSSMIVQDNIKQYLIVILSNGQGKYHNTSFFCLFFLVLIMNIC